MKTPHGYAEINAQFGFPANHNGTLNTAWQHANIVTAAPPAGWKLYYPYSPKQLVPVHGIAMHKLLVPSFTDVMTEIWEYAKAQIGGAPTDEAIQTWLHNLRVDITAGGFNFRPSTGDPTKLSLHSYGIAIDWDPDHNPHKKPLTKTLPDWWFNIWAKHGWSDGRHFATPDPMHVQFATGA